MMSVSALPPVERELVRKMIHVALALALLVPLSPEYEKLAKSAGLTSDPAPSSYAILLVSALFVSTLRVRKPELRESLLKITREARRAILLHVGGLGPLQEIARGVEQALDRAEEGFFSLIETLERDYEKRYGYVAAICAVASVLASYVLFGAAATVRGVVALAVVDPAASLLTLYLPRGRKLLKHYAFSPLAAAILLALTLVAIGDEPPRALALSIAAALIELVSPEDNLTLPLGVSALHYFLE